MKLIGLAAVLGLAVASCGGDDGASCASTTACGGDVSPGRYRISSVCATLDGTLPLDNCPAGIKLHLLSVDYNGTLTLNADKTYQTDTTAKLSLVETFPLECLNNGGTRITCEQLDQAVKAQADPGMTASCTGSSSCACTVTVPGQHQTATGTWATSGNTFTTMSDGDTDQSQYCATPTSLTLLSGSMNLMGMGMDPDFKGSSTMVLTKE